MLADPAFPAASANLTVVVSGIQLYDRLTLWYQNLAFDYIAPGGILGTADLFRAGRAEPRRRSPSGRPPTLTTSPRPDRRTVPPSPRTWRPSQTLIRRFTSPTPRSSNVITFTPKVNTKAVVNVSGYTLWLITDPVDAFIATNLAGQINNYDWVDANTTHGLLATIDPAHANQIIITAAQYGTVNANENCGGMGFGSEILRHRAWYSRS